MSPVRCVGSVVLLVHSYSSLQSLSLTSFVKKKISSSKSCMIAAYQHAVKLYVPKGGHIIKGSNDFWGQVKKKWFLKFAHPIQLTFWFT